MTHGKQARSPAAGQLLQEGDEWREYIAHDVVVHLDENVEDGKVTNNDWRHRVKRYPEGRAEVHAHFLAWHDWLEGASPPRYLCAAFHATPEYLEGPAAGGWDESCDVLHPFRIDDRPFVQGSDDVQDTVFVEPVEFVQPPQGMFVKTVSSVVRLQALDDCLSGRIDALDLGEAAPGGGQSGLGMPASALMEPGVSVPILVVEDREFRELRDVVGQRGSKRRREFEREVIERRAVALQAVPDNERKFVGGKRRRIEPNTICACVFRIGLLGDGLMTCIDPVINNSLDLLQVVLRP